jgi:uncharacterized BrkB/YihY/UPF0761 family membrane protein
MTRTLPEYGTLLIAGLLLLLLVFAGFWIDAAVTPGGKPWNAIPWFLLAAAAMTAAGIGYYIAPNRRRRKRGNAG